MEKPLKCAKLLSLKEIVLRSVIVHLCNGSDILPTMMRFRLKEQSIKDWRTIEDEIKHKILKLKIPELLMKQMAVVVRPIGFGIRTWKHVHEKSFNLSCIEIFEDGSAKLSFTTEGAVDYRRTAEELVRCNKINVVQRYQLACSYWLEDCIPLLWEELAEEDKDYFYRKNSALQGLQFSWPRIFNGREPNLDCFLRQTDRYLTSFNQWAFEHSVKMCYKTAAQHFFQKLSHQEKEASLMESARRVFLNREHVPEEGLYDIFCCLLSLMTPKQQMEIVKACPLGVLSCFLDWPRRDLFLEVAGLVWPFLPPSVYKHLLQKIIHRYDKDEFPNFFPDFYKQSPRHFKNFFVCEDDGAHDLLSTFFDYDDSESIKVMFNSVDAVDKMRLVLHPRVLQLFYIGMLKDKWHLVELCLREAMQSGEDRGRLKATFLESLEGGYLPLTLEDYLNGRMDRQPINLRDPKLKIFYDFLDETDASVDQIKRD